MKNDTLLTASEYEEVKQLMSKVGRINFSPEWKRLFEIYNAYNPGHVLSRHCLPCYGTVRYFFHRLIGQNA